MSNELTESERAVAKILSHSYNYRFEPSRLLGPEEFASEALVIVAAVRSIIEAEITQHPDVNQLNRGFGNCPHCLSPRVTHCHECLNNIERDSAHAAGWRMDHLSGYGCISLCPNCRDDQIAEFPLGHEFKPVNGHPDDDECTFRNDGTDLTYCGETRSSHDNH